MKKIKILLQLIAVMLFMQVAHAQVVTTSPAIIYQNYTGKIVITFHPDRGNQGMVGATACYAHTGATTSAGSWLCAPTWRGGEDKYKMIQVGDTWQLTIDNMYNYYDCLPDTAVITQLCFVFNDGPDGTKEGKEADGGDIFVNLYKPGLTVVFGTPTDNQLITKGTSVAFTATASDSVQMQLQINNVVKQTTEGSALSYTQAFDSTGDYTCIVSAANPDTTVYDTVYVTVPEMPKNLPVPSGALAGINYDNDSTATLVMYAKDKNGVIADNIFVVGDFNHWVYNNSYQMNKADTTGYFWITLHHLVPQKEYAFQYEVKFDTSSVRTSDAYSQKVLDPWNDKYIDNSVYPDLMKYPDGGEGVVSVLETGKPEFQWSDSTLNFKRPNKNNLVVYELWIHDFSPAGTIHSVTQRLDYLQSLGVTAIELMPITEFDGNVSWGYNPNHYFAPDKAYGTEDDYKTFIDECHKHGMAVILDMVFNQSTGNCPFAELYWDGTNNRPAADNPWYNVVAPHPYSVFEDFNHEFWGTREYFDRVLQFWIQEYHVDGYRMDLTKGFTNTPSTTSTVSNYDPSRIAILEGYYDAVRAVDSTAFFIIEHFCVNSEETVLSNYGMLPWKNLNNAFSQTAMGWLRDGDDLSGMNTTGWISYAESHDEERNFYKAKMYGNGNVTTDSTARLGRVPLNVAFAMMQKGPKMMWMFGELGYDYSLSYGGNNVDPKPVPETLGWYRDPLRMQAYVKTAQVLKLRDKYADLFADGTCTSHVGSGASARSIVWNNDTDKMVIVGNFNVEDGTTYSGNASLAPFTSTGIWYDYFNQTTLNVTSTDQTITLEPGELRIYTNHYDTLPTISNDYVFPDAVDNPASDNAQCIAYPTYTDGMVWIQSNQYVKNIRLFNLNGQIVLQNEFSSHINIAPLNKGLYIMVVTTNKTQKAFKIIRK